MDYEESNEERRGDLIELMIALSTIFGFTGSLVLIVYASYSGNEIIDTPILLMLITVIIREYGALSAHYFSRKKGSSTNGRIGNGPNI